jgi:cytochrome c oxidase assembly factor CtaG
MVVPIMVILLISGLIVWRWVIGIDYMHKNHPDYKGEDLFGEDEEHKN